MFALMSHQCVCNARYSLHPSTLSMHVRARKRIQAGEEITVQYLSALSGNHRRSKKIRLVSVSVTYFVLIIIIDVLSIGRSGTFLATASGALILLSADLSSALSSVSPAPTETSCPRGAQSQKNGHAQSVDSRPERRRWRP